MTHRILVVDDSEPIRKLLSRFLKKIGYEVSLAEDGRAALELIRKAPPSLVLLDIRMPGMGGVEFLEAARADHPELAVIMITGEGDEDQANKTMALGAVDFIMKPLDLDYLETSVKAKLATLIR